MDGILNINKPSGPTSHDVVSKIRRAVGQKRVGHAGTLDPGASGVLLICLGNATRVVEYLMDQHKTYVATAVFGAETDTEDGFGNIIREMDCSHIDRLALESVLPKFLGKIMQTPPMVSAVHHEGRRLYELAREGKVVERTPREVEIYSLKLLDFTPGDKPSAILEIECSKGTYMRTLCADIGQALGCGGYMAELVRTAVGRFKAEDAVTIETVQEKAVEGRLGDIIHTVDEVLVDMPSITVSDDDVAKVVNGVFLPVSLFADQHIPEMGEVVRILGPDKHLIAIGSLRRLHDGEDVLKPDKVFGR